MNGNAGKEGWGQLNIVTFRAPQLPELKRKDIVLFTEEHRHRWQDNTKM